MANPVTPEPLTLVLYQLSWYYGESGEGYGSVYLTPELAMAASPGGGDWRAIKDYWERPALASERGTDRSYGTFYIERVAFQVDNPTAAQRLAVAILAGDPMALDAAQDILTRGGG